MLKKVKVLVLGLAALMVLSMFSGCSGTNVNKDNTSNSDSSEKAKVTKLSVMTIPASAQFPDGKSIMNNEFIDLIKKETGYDIEWSLFKAGTSYEEQVMLLMASGSAPDAMQIIPSTVISNLAKSGGLTELDQAYEKNASFLKKVYTKELLESQKINGKMYYLSRYVAPASLGSMAVRIDWLEELGLKTPKTLDEYYEVLKKFKEAKKDCTPLMVGGGTDRFFLFASAFGILLPGGGPGFTIENGKATYPLLTDKCKDFIKTMNLWYKEGLIDKEFLMDKEVTQKMLAGKGGMMFLNYVEIARNMKTFKEKNPNGKLEYVEPPVGKNGEVGQIPNGNGVALTWIIPKSSAAKAGDVVKFLDICNENTKLSDVLCYGIEGTHYKREGNNLVALPDYSKVVYKGYYSRVILDSKFDSSWVQLEGAQKYIDDANKLGKFQLNDIIYKPLDVPATSSTLVELNKAVSDGVLEMVVSGYSDDKFNALKDKFSKLQGDQMLKEIQAWADTRKK